MSLDGCSYKILEFLLTAHSGQEFVLDVSTFVLGVFLFSSFISSIAFIVTFGIMKQQIGSKQDSIPIPTFTMFQNQMARIFFFHAPRTNTKSEIVPIIRIIIPRTKGLSMCKLNGKLYSKDYNFLIE